MDDKRNSFIFRYHQNNYIRGDSTIVFADEFRLMRRLSSRGWLGPLEDIRNAGFDSLSWEQTCPLRDGELYEAIYCPGTPDYETGNVEDWTWKIVPYREEQEPNPVKSESVLRRLAAQKGEE